MKKNIANNLILACSLLIMASCAAHKKAIVRKADTTTAATANNSANAKIAAIRSAQTSFGTFAGRAKTSLSFNGHSNDVTLNIRIQHDKKIWVSITAIFGIEAARALITPDSIMVINKLQSVYIKKPFSYIHTFASRQVNYQTLEALLIGNAIPQLVSTNDNISVQGNDTVLSGTLQDLMFKLILGADMRVTQTNLDNQAQQQSLQAINGSFIQATNRIMPSEIDLSSVVKDKKIQVNLHYNKADFEVEQNYPFSIPDSYQPAN